MKKVFLLFFIIFIFAMMMCMPTYALDTIGDSPAVVSAPDGAEMLNLLISYAFEIVSAILMALIGVVGTWLSTKIAKHTQLANISSAIEQVIQSAQITVGELQQTTVSSLKAAAPNGKLTDMQIKDLKQKLLQKTFEKLSDPVIHLLDTTKTDVNAIIAGVAEDLINKMKSG